jgi:DNA-directed RNA polymerase subunit H (RpoH/RPB5)
MSIVKSFGTILEMLQDRNIDVANVNASMMQEVEDKNTSHFHVQINNVSVIYFLSSPFKWPQFQKFLSESVPDWTDNDAGRQYILVIQDKLSVQAQDKLDGLGIKIQVFTIGELQFNITKHILVPKHEKLSSQDALQVLSTYNLKSVLQLPIILKKDPMSRYLGLAVGDVVKIHRDSQTSGEYFVYRCCA